MLRTSKDFINKSRRNEKENVKIVLPLDYWPKKSNGQVKSNVLF
jgi:hypothetical protein